MAGLNQLDASPVRPPGSVHGDGHSQFGNAASAAADGERERPPTLPPVCLPPLEWLNPRPTKREKGREGAGAAEDLWRNGVCHGPSSSLPLSTLLSSRAITHIFYDIALLPSLSHLRSSRFAVKRDFACLRRRRRLLSPLSPLMLHHQDTEADRQRFSASVPCGRCTRFISNGGGGGIGGHHHQVVCLVLSVLLRFLRNVTCDANFQFESKNNLRLKPKVSAMVSWEVGEEIRR